MMTSSPGPMPIATCARCSAAVQLETATACRAPIASAKAASNSWVRGPMVSHPERNVAATASRSSSENRRSKTGIRCSGDVPVTLMPGIVEAAVLETLEDLRNPVWNSHLRLVTEPISDLVEAHLVVARVLVTMHKVDLP